MTELSELVACPVTGRPLSFQAGAWVTPDGNAYPVIDDIPWLVPQPGPAIGSWQARFHLELAHRNEGARGSPDQRYQQAVARYGKELNALMPGLLTSKATDPAHYAALRTRLPPALSLFGYDANVFRDWSWGQAENEQSHALVAGSMATSATDVLVLGAGAGRLAYDLHQQGAQSHTVAVDLNPFLLTLARKLSAGETVALHEFPLAPRKREDRALARSLRTKAARPGLSWLLADVRWPPFQPGCFDTVVTPWLLDVVDQLPAQTASLLNHLLRPGGRWISFGSFAFDHTKPGFDLTPEDLPALLAAHGFSNATISEHSLPYLQSPHSRHGRLEQVVLFAADKTSEGSYEPFASGVPEWLLDLRQPVPQLPAFATQAQATKIHAYIMSLIDGQRSIQTIAAVLEKHGIMDAGEAAGTLRGFFLKMWDEAAH